MRSSFLLLTVALLLWSSCSARSIAVGVVGTVSRADLNCLKTALGPGNTVNLFLVRLYRSTNTPVGVDPRGAQTIANAQNQGLFTMSYLQYCPGQDPIAQVNAIDAAFKSTSQYLDPKAFPVSRLIVVKVLPSRDPTCSWDLASPVLNCQNLGRYIQELKNKRYSPHIYASLTDWTRFFQGVACLNFAQEYSTPLFYANYYKGQGSNVILDSNPDYGDFTPFGGWTKPLGKKIEHNLKVPLNCGPKPRNITVEKFIFS